LTAFYANISSTLGKPRSAVYQIPLNEDGIPVLPQIDASEATASQLAQLLDEYFVSLWSTYRVIVSYATALMSRLFFADFSCATDENVPAIPWDEVVNNPDRYFDTSLYKLPFALKAPDTLKSNPLHIFALHEYFLSTSTSVPFQFRSTLSIKEFNNLGIENEVAAGEDDLSTAAALPTPSTGTATNSNTQPHSIPSFPTRSICNSPSNKPNSEAGTAQSSPQPANLEQFTPPNLSITLQSPTITNSGPNVTASSVSKVVKPPAKNPSARTKGAGKKGKGLPKKATQVEPAATSAPAAVKQVAARVDKPKLVTQNPSSRPKDAKTVAETQPRDVVVEPPQAKSRTSTRTSGRAKDLKRKQADREVGTAEKSGPAKKKTRLEDRWFYEVGVPPVIPAA
jgi:hypothetical protein